MNLLKLRDGHVIVSEYEALAQDGDYFIPYYNPSSIVVWKNTNGESVYVRKIIASNFISGLPTLDFSMMSHGDRSAIGIIDFDELALGYEKDDFLAGFKAAQKLFADKLYTQEHVWEAFVLGMCHIDVKEVNHISPDLVFKTYMERLNMPKQWIVDTEEVKSNGKLQSIKILNINFYDTQDFRTMSSL